MPSMEDLGCFLLWQQFLLWLPECKSGLFFEGPKMGSMVCVVGIRFIARSLCCAVFICLLLIVIEILHSCFHLPSGADLRCMAQ